MAAPKTPLQEIKDQIANNDVKMVRFEVADPYGAPKCRVVPAAEFESSALGGHWFAGAAFANTPWGTFLPANALPPKVYFGDVLTKPVLETFRVLPWCKQTARVITMPLIDGNRATFVPGNMALRQLEGLADMGFSLLSGFEHEFVLYHRDTHPPVLDQLQYLGLPRLSDTEDFVLQLFTDLPKVGLSVSSVEAEDCPGMMEISCKPGFGIAGADQAYTCKQAIKEIARKNGYLASFMTKPFSNNGTIASNYNISLWDVKQQSPLLLDADSLELSEVGQHWIAGLVEHAPSLAVLMAPTMNCIRAFNGSEPVNAMGPCSATWGIRDRSVALNVKLSGARESYIENRMASGGSDPYTVLAATVAAGMDGITRKLPLQRDVTGTVRKPDSLRPQARPLPRTMRHAVQALMDDQVIKESLGNVFIDWFVEAKRYEMRAHAQAPDPWKWEQNAYFDV